MNRSTKSAEIIERIEYIRNYLRLNKSRFSTEIGLKPQTYNNFIGSQGSKPSVDLILGTVNRFGASPNWILNGRGSVFQEWSSEQEQRMRPAGDMGTWAGQLSDQSLAAPGFEQQRVDILQKLNSLEERTRENERRLEAIEGSRFPLLREFRSLLMQLLDLDPAKAEEMATEMVAKLKNTVKQQRDGS